jgi:hypothetical protein
MNKQSRLRLQLSRTSVRPLTSELASAHGGRPRLASSDPTGIGTSGCDPHCETSNTGTTTIVLSAIRC